MDRLQFSCSALHQSYMEQVISWCVLIGEKETWFDRSKLTIGGVTMLSLLVCPRLVPVLKQQHLVLFYKKLILNNKLSTVILLESFNLCTPYLLNSFEFVQSVGYSKMCVQLACL